MINRKAKQGIAVGTGQSAAVLQRSHCWPYYPSIGSEPTPPPPVAPVSACTTEDRAAPPPKPNPIPVSEKAATIEPHNTHATEIDFEPQKHSGGTGISTPTQPPRDNPTPAPVIPKTPQPQAPNEPKMGDTRTVDGQKQVYFLGFGWIDDSDTPNEVYYAEDMYENGNKVGIIGGSTCVDGDGDINKIVGTMD